MGIVFCSIDITIQMITSQMHTADAMMNARGKSPSYENSSNEFQQRIPATNPSESKKHKIAHTASYLPNWHQLSR
ncbi:hypothetical protein N9250_00360 [bacterium]|nr:hypothetical protein [bacterium]